MSKKKRCFAALSALFLSATALGAQPEAPSPDAFLDAIAGSWAGTGIVYGSQVELTRTWERDLAGHFVRADMHVRMSRGGFRALAFWRSSGPSRYAITWMDELGDTQAFDAVFESSTKSVTLYYVEEEEGRTEWRRLVYRLTGADSYDERMHRQTADGWEEIATFEFARQR